MLRLSRQICRNIIPKNGLGCSSSSVFVCAGLRKGCVQNSSRRLFSGTAANRYADDFEDVQLDINPSNAIFVDGSTSGSLSLGDLTLENGEVVYENRSACNLLYKHRVLKHTSSTVDGLEREIQEHQTVYDGGDPHSEETIVRSKALVQTKPTRLYDLISPSSALLGAVSIFIPTQPRNVLVLGSWLGSIANYYANVTQADVHIVDRDIIAKDAARDLLQFIPSDKPDIPVHPFDMMVHDAENQEITEVVHDITYFVQKKSTGVISIGDKFTTPEAFLEALYADTKDFSMVDKIIQEREDYEKQIKVWEKECAQLERVEKDSVKPKKPCFHSKYSEDKLNKYSTFFQKLAKKAVYTYDLIIQDTESYPGLTDVLQLQRIAGALEPHILSGRHTYGVFARRVSLLDPTAAKAFPFANQDMEKLQTVLDRTSSVFKNVYYGQADATSAVVIATNSPIFGDMSRYPVTSETMVDAAVMLWERQLMTLDVLETTDALKQFVPGQKVEISFDKQDFQV